MPIYKVASTSVVDPSCPLTLGFAEGRAHLDSCCDKRGSAPSARDAQRLGNHRRKPGYKRKKSYHIIRVYEPRATTALNHRTRIFATLPVPPAPSLSP